MTPGNMRTHDTQRAAHLARLRMLAGDEASAAMPHTLTRQITRITGLILAEAEAAGHAVAVTAAEGPRAAAAERFLAARLARMAAAAQDAAAAAERGDAAALRRQLLRFDTLTSAMWAVLAALRPAAPASRQRPHPYRGSGPAVGNRSSGAALR